MALKTFPKGRAKSLKETSSPKVKIAPPFMGALVRGAKIIFSDNFMKTLNLVVGNQVLLGSSDKTQNAVILQIKDGAVIQKDRSINCANAVNAIREIYGIATEMERFELSLTGKTFSDDDGTANYTLYELSWNQLTAEQTVYFEAKSKAGIARAAGRKAKAKIPALTFVQ